MHVRIMLTIYTDIHTHRYIYTYIHTHIDGWSRVRSTESISTDIIVLQQCIHITYKHKHTHIHKQTHIDGLSRVRSTESISTDGWVSEVDAIAASARTLRMCKLRPFGLI